jgi:peroxiredoxin
MRYFLTIGLFLLCFGANAQVPPKGLQVNDKAPMILAKDQNGKLFSLKEALQKGSVVVVFYRGQWCPYCNRQLKGLEDSLSLIKGKGAELVAVTPEIAENISKTISKTKASYPILFDDGLKIMKSYDVAYALDSSTIGKYKKFGVDFTMANGANGANLPVPTVYVIDSRGIIVFKHFDPDFTKRVSVREILAHL